MSEAIKDREDLTVFVSYKYSEAKETKDKILGALGKSGLHYEGWIAENPNDNSSFYARTAKDNLAVDILEAADVVVVVLSPNITDSEWVKWEVGYALGKIEHNGKRISKPRTVVLVEQFREDDMDWLELSTLAGYKKYMSILKHLSLLSEDCRKGLLVKPIYEMDFINNSDRYIKEALSSGVKVITREELEMYKQFHNSDNVQLVDEKLL